MSATNCFYFKEVLFQKGKFGEVRGTGLWSPLDWRPTGVSGFFFYIYIKKKKRCLDCLKWKVHLLRSCILSRMKFAKRCCRPCCNSKYLEKDTTSYKKACIKLSEGEDWSSESRNYRDSLWIAKSKSTKKFKMNRGEEKKSRKRKVGCDIVRTRL